MVPRLPKSEDGCAASGMADCLLRKSSGNVGELGRIESFNYAGLSECAAGDLIVSRKACRVALRRFCSFGASASHKNDYRFFRFTREVGKSSSVHERFEIAGDDFGSLSLIIYSRMSLSSMSHLFPIEHALLMPMTPSCRRPA